MTTADVQEACHFLTTCKLTFHVDISVSVHSRAFATGNGATSQSVSLAPLMDLGTETGVCVKV